MLAKLQNHFKDNPRVEIDSTPMMINGVPAKAMGLDPIYFVIVDGDVTDVDERRTYRETLAAILDVVENDKGCNRCQKSGAICVH